MMSERCNGFFSKSFCSSSTKRETMHRCRLLLIDINLPVYSSILRQTAVPESSEIWSCSFKQSLEARHENSQWKIGIKGWYIQLDIFRSAWCISSTPFLILTHTTLGCALQSQTSQLNVRLLVTFMPFSNPPNWLSRRIYNMHFSLNIFAVAALLVSSTALAAYEVRILWQSFP